MSLSVRCPIVNEQGQHAVEIQVSGDPRARAALNGAACVVVFFAHPDDVDFGAGGTIASLSARGTRVIYVVMTDGDAGGFEDSSRAEIVETRHEEQRLAARIVGVEDVIFLGQRDGHLYVNESLVGKVVEIVRTYSPEVVVSMHPERNWSRIQKSHPDHLACGEIVTRAMYPAVENNYAFEDLRKAGLEAYKVPWLFLFAGPDHLSNVAVDVTTMLERKIQALDVHMSQHPDPEAMHEHVRSQSRQKAEAFSWEGELQGGERFAETFHAVAINAPETIAGF